MAEGDPVVPPEPAAEAPTIEPAPAPSAPAPAPEQPAPAAKPTRGELWLRRSPELLAWLALAACTRGTFAVFEHGLREPSPLYNSDSLFLAELFRDLLKGYAFTDWSLPHATYLLPDFTLWMLVDTLTPSVQWATMMYGLVQFGLFAALARLLLVRDTGPHAGPAIAAGYAVVFCFFGLGRSTSALDAVKPVHHFSVALVGLAAIWMLDRVLTQPKSRWTWVVPIYLLVATGSDPFALTCVSAPVVGITLLAVVRERSERLRRLLFAVACAVLAVLGQRYGPGIFGVPGENTHIDWNVFPGQWKAFWGAVAGLNLELIDGLAILGALWCVALFFRGLYRIKQPGMGPILDLFPLIAMVVNELSLMATGNVEFMQLADGRGIFNRYVTVPFAYLVLTTVRVPAQLGALRRWLPSAAAVVACIAAVVMWRAVLAQPKQFAFTEYQPEAAECLDKLDPRIDVHRGMAEFWNGRLVEMLNKRGVQIDVINSVAAPQIWLNNKKRYKEADPLYDFVLVRGMYPQAVQTRYGNPDFVVNCGSQQLWWYAPEHRQAVTAAVAAQVP